jgi:integrase
MSVTKCIRIKDKKKTSVFRAQVYVSGVRVADRMFDTQAAAYAWHDSEKDRIESGLAGEDDVPDLSFDECLTRYMNEKQGRLEQSSRQAREVRCKHLRNSPLSSIKMKRLNSKAIDLWLTWVCKQSTASNPGRKSFLIDLRFLAAVLNWYRNYIDASYVVPVTKRHREMAVYKKIRPRRPDYFARPEEVRAWIDWLQGHRNPVYFQLASYLVLTGCRVGEAAGLFWSEVDLDKKMARIMRVVVWDQNTKRPQLEERAKTDGSIRLIMLPEVLVSLLREMKREAKDPRGPIFLGRDGELLKYNAIQSAFNAGFKALNLPWRSTHICRHTYATLALMATGNLGGVQAALGHKTQQMTERYAKNVSLLQSGTAEKAASLLSLNISK